VPARRRALADQRATAKAADDERTLEAVMRSRPVPPATAEAEVVDQLEALTREENGLRLAIERAESTLFAAVEPVSRQWMAALDGEAKERETRARDAIAAADGAIADLAAVVAGKWWVTEPRGSFRVVPPVGPKSSTRTTQSGLPVDIGRLVSWLTEVVDQQAGRTTPAEEVSGGVPLMVNESPD
jgi:hypothetical protein